MSSDNTTETTATPCAWCQHPRHRHAFGCADCLCPYTTAELNAKGRQEGEAGRDEGITHVHESQDDESVTWRTDALDWMEALPNGHRFTAVELTDHLGLSPRPTAVGAAIRTAALHETIRHTGEYVRTSRPAAHARPIAVWERTA
jgi:hypothetical protein